MGIKICLDSEFTGFMSRSGRFECTNTMRVIRKIRCRRIICHSACGLILSTIRILLPPLLLNLETTSMDNKMHDFEPSIFNAKLQEVVRNEMMQAVNQLMESLRESVAVEVKEQMQSWRGELEGVLKAQVLDPVEMMKKDIVGMKGSIKNLGFILNAHNGASPGSDWKGAIQGEVQRLSGRLDLIDVKLHACIQAIDTIINSELSEAPKEGESGGGNIIRTPVQFQKRLMDITQATYERDRLKTLWKERTAYVKQDQDRQPAPSVGSAGLGNKSMLKSMMPSGLGEECEVRGKSEDRHEPSQGSIPFEAAERKDDIGNASEIGSEDIAMQD